LRRPAVVTNFFLLVLVFLGVALYFMTAAERTRVLQATLAALRTAKDAVTWQTAQDDPFFAALRARHPRVVATPALIVLNAIVFMFVPSPALDLVISAACLLQIGLILERIVGRAAFTTVYVASGVAAGIASLSISPGGFSVTPSGPILGMYGLLLVTSAWTTFSGSSLAIPLNVAKRLAPVAAVFLLYKLTTGGGNVAALAPLICGVVGGFVVARDLNEPTPRFRALAKAMATVLVVVGLYAATARYEPVNDTNNVRAEIDQVIALEDRTASLYDQEVIRFRKGRITTAALIDLIDKTIVPELRAAAVRLRKLDNVSPEQQRVIDAAERFLKMRDESWQLRAAALHNSDIRGLRNADSKEQASREAFDRLKMPG
jgi:membrane associated rhomboid family serine protease